MSDIHGELYHANIYESYKGMCISLVADGELNLKAAEFYEPTLGDCEKNSVVVSLWTNPVYLIMANPSVFLFDFLARLNLMI